MKDEFGLSSYLKLSKFPLHRIVITKLRLSAHKLPIEVGRYEQIPRHERRCPLGCPHIGDEVHYIFQCSHPFMQDLRNNLISRMVQTGEWNTLQGMGHADQLMNLLKSPLKETVCLIGSYAFKIFKLFKDLTI